MSGSLKKGARIANRYVTTRRIGEGQFSAVYEVQDCKDQKKYAVKIEKCKDVGPSVKQEHRTLQRVREACPQMCHAIKCGSHTDGRFFILMHLLGMNLVEARKAEPGGRMQPGDVKRIAACVLDALKAVHSAGYVHRDVKPANIAQVPPESRQAMEWILIDFGLAKKYVDHEGNLVPPRPESKENFRGSTTYASVHAHTGQDLGRRDDLFSWLYVVAELLEGTLPWRRESHAADRECGHHQATSGGPSSGVQGATSATSTTAAAATLAGDYREAVRASKQQCVADPVHLVPTCPFPEPFVHAANYLAQLSFESEPDYAFLHNCLAHFPDHWPPAVRPLPLTNGATHPHILQQQHLMQYQHQQHMQQQQHMQWQQQQQLLQQQQQQWQQHSMLSTTPSPLAQPPLPHASLPPWHDMPPTLTPPHATTTPCSALPTTPLFPPHLPPQQPGAVSAAPLQQHAHILGVTPTQSSSTQHPAAAGMSVSMAGSAAPFSPTPLVDSQHITSTPMQQGVSTGGSTAQPAAILYPPTPLEAQHTVSPMQGGTTQPGITQSGTTQGGTTQPGITHSGVTQGGLTSMPLQQSMSTGTALPVSAPPPDLLHASGHPSPQPPWLPGFGGFGGGVGGAQPQPFLLAGHAGGHSPQSPLPPGYGGYGAGAGSQEPQSVQQQQQQQLLYQHQWQQQQHQQQQQQGPSPPHLSPQPFHVPPLSPVSPAAPSTRSPTCPPPLPPEPYTTTAAAAAAPSVAATSAHHSAFPEHCLPPAPAPSLGQDTYPMHHLHHQPWHRQHHDYYQQQQHHHQQQQQAGLPMHGVPSMQVAHSSTPPTPPITHLPRPSPLPTPAQHAAVDAEEAQVKPLSPGTYLEGGAGEGESEKQEGDDTVEMVGTKVRREMANFEGGARLGTQGGSVEIRDAKRPRVEGWDGLSSPAAGVEGKHHHHQHQQQQHHQQQQQCAHAWGDWAAAGGVHSNGMMSAAEGEAQALGRVNQAIAHLEQSQQLMLGGGPEAACARNMLACMNPADALTVMASVAFTSVQRVHGEPDCSNMATQMADLSVFMRHCAQLAQQRGAQHRQ